MAATADASFLRVGSYHGIRGQFGSIQAAVNAAEPGDWILIGPGDYKTTSSRLPAGQSDVPSAVLITKRNLRLRGMNRNTVIVDGTRPGSPRCSSAPSAQNLGPAGMGLNGVMVYKADNVWVQNLTACNFLSGTGNAGNEVWWNGGDGSAMIGGWGFDGSYLTATSTYWGADESTAAAYGIFSSNWSGGTWYRDYASNFNDSGFYIGACQQVCDQTVTAVWSEFNALGYSGSNSGGQLVVKDSQFDSNKDGFDTNSQNGDNPPPQDGSCPNGAVSPITHTHSCWVFMDNYVHDNNNPNVPSSGLASGGPVGTGISISGGRNDTVMNNRFERNGAWGTIFVPFPDSGPPCTGGTQTQAACVYDEWGDALIGNTYGANGFFGNPTNGDFGFSNTEPGPTSCFAGNTEEGGGSVKSAPSNAEQLYPTCTGQTVLPSDLNPQSLQFTAEVACDSQASVPPLGAVPCAPTDHYPRRTAVVMHPLPRNLATMPNPCAGVPSNPWCTSHAAKRHKRHKAKHKAKHKVKHKAKRRTKQ